MRVATSPPSPVVTPENAPRRSLAIFLRRAGSDEEDGGTPVGSDCWAAGQPAPDPRTFSDRDAPETSLVDEFGPGFSPDDGLPLNQTVFLAPDRTPTWAVWPIANYTSRARELVPRSMAVEVAIEYARVDDECSTILRAPSLYQFDVGPVGVMPKTLTSTDESAAEDAYRAATGATSPTFLTTASELPLVLRPLCHVLTPLGQTVSTGACDYNLRRVRTVNVRPPGAETCAPGVQGVTCRLMPGPCVDGTASAHGGTVAVTAADSSGSGVLLSTRRSASSLSVSFLDNAAATRALLEVTGVALSLGCGGAADLNVTAAFIRLPSGSGVCPPVASSPIPGATFASVLAGFVGPDQGPESQSLGPPLPLGTVGGCNAVCDGPCMGGCTSGCTTDCTEVCDRNCTTTSASLACEPPCNETCTLPCPPGVNSTELSPCGLGCPDNCTDLCSFTPANTFCTVCREICEGGCTTNCTTDCTMPCECTTVEVPSLPMTALRFSGATMVDGGPASITSWVDAAGRSWLDVCPEAWGVCLTEPDTEAHTLCSVSVTATGNLTGIATNGSFTARVTAELVQPIPGGDTRFTLSWGEAYATPFGPVDTGLLGGSGTRVHVSPDGSCIAVDPSGSAWSHDLPDTVLFAGVPLADAALAKGAASSATATGAVFGADGASLLGTEWVEATEGVLAIPAGAWSSLPVVALAGSRACEWSVLASPVEPGGCADGTADCATADLEVVHYPDGEPGAPSPVDVFSTPLAEDEDDVVDVASDPDSAFPAALTVPSLGEYIVEACLRTTAPLDPDAGSEFTLFEDTDAQAVRSTVCGSQTFTVALRSAPPLPTFSGPAATPETDLDVTDCAQTRATEAGRPAQLGGVCAVELTVTSSLRRPDTSGCDMGLATQPALTYITAPGGFEPSGGLLVQGTQSAFFDTLQPTGRVLTPDEDEAYPFSVVQCLGERGVADAGGLPLVSPIRAALRARRLPSGRPMDASTPEIVSGEPLLLTSPSDGEAPVTLTRIASTQTVDTGARGAGISVSFVETPFVQDSISGPGPVRGGGDDSVAASLTAQDRSDFFGTFTDVGPVADAKIFPVGYTTTGVSPNQRCPPTFAVGTQTNTLSSVMLTVRDSIGTPSDSLRGRDYGDGVELPIANVRASFVSGIQEWDDTGHAFWVTEPGQTAFIEPFGTQRTEDVAVNRQVFDQGYPLVMGPSDSPWNMARTSLEVTGAAYRILEVVGDGSVYEAFRMPAVPHAIGDPEDGLSVMEAPGSDVEFTLRPADAFTSTGTSLEVGMNVFIRGSRHPHIALRTPSTIQGWRPADDDSGVRVAPSGDTGPAATAYDTLTDPVSWPGGEVPLGAGVSTGFMAFSGHDGVDYATRCAAVSEEDLGPTMGLSPDAYESLSASTGAAPVGTQVDYAAGESVITDACDGRTGTMSCNDERTLFAPMFQVGVPFDSDLNNIDQFTDGTTEFYGGVSSLLAYKVLRRSHADAERFRSPAPSVGIRFRRHGTGGGTEPETGIRTDRLRTGDRLAVSVTVGGYDRVVCVLTAAFGDDVPPGCSYSFEVTTDEGGTEALRSATCYTLLYWDDLTATGDEVIVGGERPIGIFRCPDLTGDPNTLFPVGIQGFGYRIGEVVDGETGTCPAAVDVDAANLELRPDGLATEFTAGITQGGNEGYESRFVHATPQDALTSLGVSDLASARTSRAESLVAGQTFIASVPVRGPGRAMHDASRWFMTRDGGGALETLSPIYFGGAAPEAACCLPRDPVDVAVPFGTVVDANQGAAMVCAPRCVDAASVSSGGSAWTWGTGRGWSVRDVESLPSDLVRVTLARSVHTAALQDECTAGATGIESASATIQWASLLAGGGILPAATVLAACADPVAYALATDVCDRAIADDASGLSPDDLEVVVFTAPTTDHPSCASGAPLPTSLADALTADGLAAGGLLTDTCPASHAPGLWLAEAIAEPGVAGEAVQEVQPFVLRAASFTASPSPGGMDTCTPVEGSPLCSTADDASHCVDSRSVNPADLAAAIEDDVPPVVETRVLDSGQRVVNMTALQEGGIPAPTCILDPITRSWTTDLTSVCSRRDSFVFARTVPDAPTVYSNGPGRPEQRIYVALATTEDQWQAAAAEQRDARRRAVDLEPDPALFRPPPAVPAVRALIARQAALDGFRAPIDEMGGGAPDESQLLLRQLCIDDAGLADPNGLDDFFALDLAGDRAPRTRWIRAGQPDTYDNGKWGIADGDIICSPCLVDDIGARVQGGAVPAAADPLGIGCTHGPAPDAMAVRGLWTLQVMDVSGATPVVSLETHLAVLVAATPSDAPADVTWVGDTPLPCTPEVLDPVTVPQGPNGVVALPTNLTDAFEFSGFTPAGRRAPRGIEWVTPTDRALFSSSVVVGSATLDSPMGGIACILNGTLAVTRSFECDAAFSGVSPTVVAPHDGVSGADDLAIDAAVADEFYPEVSSVPGEWADHSVTVTYSGPGVSVPPAVVAANSAATGGVELGVSVPPGATASIDHRVCLGSTVGLLVDEYCCTAPTTQVTFLAESNRPPVVRTNPFTFVAVDPPTTFELRFSVEDPDQGLSGPPALSLSHTDTMLAMSYTSRVDGSFVTVSATLFGACDTGSLLCDPATSPSPLIDVEGEICLTATDSYGDAGTACRPILVEAGPDTGSLGRSITDAILDASPIEATTEMLDSVLSLVAVALAVLMTGVFVLACAYCACTSCCLRAERYVLLRAGR